MVDMVDVVESISRRELAGLTTDLRVIRAFERLFERVDVLEKTIDAGQGVNGTVTAGANTVTIIDGIITEVT